MATLSWYPKKQLIIRCYIKSDKLKDSSRQESFLRWPKKKGPPYRVTLEKKMKERKLLCSLFATCHYRQSYNEMTKSSFTSYSLSSTP